MTYEKDFCDRSCHLKYKSWIEWWHHPLLCQQPLVWAIVIKVLTYLEDDLLLHTYLFWNLHLIGNAKESWDIDPFYSVHVAHLCFLTWPLKQKWIPKQKLITFPTADLSSLLVGTPTEKINLKLSKYTISLFSQTILTWKGDKLPTLFHRKDDFDRNQRQTERQQQNCRLMSPA